MNDEHFMKIFAISFYIILKTFCLAPFSLNFKTCEAKKSSFTALAYVVTVSLFLYFDGFLEGKIYFQGIDNNFSSKLVEVFNLLLTFKSYILIVASVLYLIVKCKAREKVYKDINEVISFLRWDTFILKMRESAYKYIKIQLVFVIYFFGVRYLHYLALQVNPKWIVLLIYVPLAQYRYFIIIAIVAQQHLIFVFFTCCFKALNIYLKAQVKICKNQSEIIDLIDKTAKAHFRLLEIIIYLNKHFSFIIVMIIFDKLVNFVVEAYIVYIRSVLYIRSHINGDIFIRFLFEVLLLGSYGVTRILQFVVILYAASETIREVSQKKKQ